jgi:hypothetical protein
MGNSNPVDNKLLNQEQKVAFDFIMAHRERQLAVPSTKPLRLIIQGSAGNQPRIFLFCDRFFI